MVRITLAQLRVGSIVMIPRIAYMATFMGRNASSDPIRADVLVWTTPKSDHYSFICTELRDDDLMYRDVSYRHPLSRYLCILFTCGIDPTLINSLHPITP